MILPGAVLRVSEGVPGFFAGSGMAGGTRMTQITQQKQGTRMNRSCGQQPPACTPECRASARGEGGAGHPGDAARKRIRRSSSLAPVCLALIAAMGLGAHGSEALASDGGELCSPETQGDLEVEFINRSSQPVSFHWMQFDCTEGGGPVLAPGQRETGISHPGHIFRVRGAGEQTLRHFVVSDDTLAFVVDDALIAHVAAQGEPYTEGSCSPRTEGRFTVEFVNLLNEPVSMQWIGFDCQVNVLRQIPAKGRTEETTFPGHVFRFVDSTGRQLRSVDVATDERVYLISEH